MALSSEELENLSDLLLSVNDDNTEIAFEILSGQKIFPKGLLTEVFVVYKLTDNDVLKDKAMTFLKHYDIDESSDIIRAKSHLKTDEGATEKRIKSNVSYYVRISEGKLDGVKMATAMFNKYNVGLHYLLDNANKAQKHKILSSFMVGSAFKMKGVSLTKVPDALYDFSDLTEIDLSMNDLSTLPVKIKAFKKLERLNISDNKIKKLPKSITTLKNLTHLDISKNRIPEFPTEILKMFQLKGLNIEQLDKYNGRFMYLTIPEDFQKLSNIQELKLSSYNAYPNNLGTNYTNYPSISALSSDTPIDLAPLKLAEYAYLNNGHHDGVVYLFFNSQDSELKHKIIKEQFYQPALRQLSFDEVQLDNFPKEIIDFQVQKIDCSDMRLGIDKQSRTSREQKLLSKEEINNLCDILGELKNIEEADFSSNDLKFVPDAILKWKHLKKLNLSRNEIGGKRSFFSDEEGEDVPNFLVDADLSNWSELEELNLEDNNILELPEGVKHLKKLRKLNLGSNSLLALPSNIKHLIGLEELRISGYSYVEALPIELAELSNLTNIEIELRNKELFDVLGKVKSLEILDVKFSTDGDLTLSNCEYIAKCLGQLSNLHTLTFFDDKMYSYNANSKEIREMYEKAFEQYLPKSCHLEMKN